MTRKSKRELERKLEDLQSTSESTHWAAIELETGEYVNPYDAPLDWDKVPFGIPYDLWHDKWGLDAPEEIHDPEAY